MPGDVRRVVVLEDQDVPIGWTPEKLPEVSKEDLEESARCSQQGQLHGMGALSQGKRHGGKQGDPGALTHGSLVFLSPSWLTLAKEGWVGDPNPIWPARVPLTFGPCEKQLVCGVQAEDRLSVALGHGHALQRGCPRTLRSSNRGDDAPSRERGREDVPVSQGGCGQAD